MYSNSNFCKIIISIFFSRPTKRKLVESKGIPQESVAPRKIKKIQDISSSLSVQEAEALAMRLLQKKT